MLLFSCSSHREVIVETKLIKSVPPKILYQQIQEPLFVGKTNQDLINYIFDLKAVIKQYNIDKKLLQEWVASEEISKDLTNE